MNESQMNAAALLEGITPGERDFESRGAGKYIVQAAGVHVALFVGKHALQDARLLAAAPELAREVVRLRTALEMVVDQAEWTAKTTGNSKLIVAAKAARAALQPSPAKVAP